jgi:hypothetical protein
LKELAVKMDEILVKERDRRKKKHNPVAAEEDERVICKMSVMQKSDTNSNSNKHKYRKTRLSFINCERISTINTI